MEFLALKGLIDGQRRLYPFGGGNHDELRVARGVTGDKDTWHIGFAERSGIHGPLATEGTPKALGDVASRMLRGSEEHRVEFERVTRLKFHRRELPFVVRDVRHPL